MGWLEALCICSSRRWSIKSSPTILQPINNREPTSIRRLVHLLFPKLYNSSWSWRREKAMTGRIELCCKFLSYLRRFFQFCFTLERIARMRRRKWKSNGLQEYFSLRLLPQCKIVGGWSRTTKLMVLKLIRLFLSGNFIWRFLQYLKRSQFLWLQQVAGFLKDWWRFIWLFPHSVLL